VLPVQKLDPFANGLRMCVRLWEGPFPLVVREVRMVCEVVGYRVGSTVTVPWCVKRNCLLQTLQL